MHHPFEVLQPFDKKKAEAYLSDCDFVLHGHIHEPEMIQALKPGRTMPNQVFAAGACYQREDDPDRTYPNSFNIVNLDFRTGKGTIFLYIYSPRDRRFWAPDTLSYPGVEGQWSFALPDKLK
jgi:hypothetical protein